MKIPTLAGPGSLEITPAEADVAAILSSLFIGAAPQSEADVAALKAQLEITAVLSLQTDDDLRFSALNWPAVRQWHRAVGLESIRLPIADFSPRDLIHHLDEAVAALDRLLRRGHTVYMHCSQGINRAPTIALAYLHAVGGDPLEDALATVIQRRPQAAPYEEVLEALRSRS